MEKLSNIVLGFVAVSFMLLTVMCFNVHAGDIDVEMGPWKCKSYVEAEMIITNNTDKYLEYVELSVIVYYKDEIVGSMSRPVTNIPSGSFVSKTFWFNTAQNIDKYKWSMVKIQLK